MIFLSDMYCDEKGCQAQTPIIPATLIYDQNEEFMLVHMDSIKQYDWKIITYLPPGFPPWQDHFCLKHSDKK